jgi:Cu/Ag efflux protein CusF
MLKRRVAILKKIKYLIITCLSIAILSYGVIAFANGGTNDDSKVLSHGDVTGKFVSMIEGNSKITLNLGESVESYPLDRSIWVFRDQKKTVLESLKSGDKIELILNSSEKVTYIKAFSEAYSTAEAATVLATPTPTPTPTATPTMEPTPTVKPEPSPTAAPNEIKQIMDNENDVDDENDVNDDNHIDNNDGNDNHHDDDRNKHDNKGEKD